MNENYKTLMEYYSGEVKSLQSLINHFEAAKGDFLDKKKTISSLKKSLKSAEKNYEKYKKIYSKITV